MATDAEGFRQWRHVVVPLTDGWVAEAELEERGWQPVVRALHVRHESGSPPPSGVPFAALRRLTQRAVLAQARADEDARAARVYADVDAGLAKGLRALDDWIEAAPAHERPGRNARWTDAQLLGLAQEYLALAAERRDPVQELARRLGSRDAGGAAGRPYNPEYVQRLLAKARERELLGPSPSGKAGGELGPRAVEMLAAHTARQ